MEERRSERSDGSTGAAADDVLARALKSLRLKQSLHLQREQRLPFLFLITAVENQKAFRNSCSYFLR